MHSDWAAELSPTLPTGPILELCAGAGHIGLAAAVATGRPLIQVERDPVAAAFATCNARAAGVCDYEMRVTAIDACAFTGEQFPLIIADPPYLRTEDVAGYPEDPPKAIDGGDDGMRIIRECMAVVATHLARDGALLLQVRGAAQLKGLRVREVREHDADRAVALITRNEIERLVIG